MEILKDEKDSLDNAVKFTDIVSKTLDGLKDRMNVLLLESEAKNEKPDNILKQWSDQANNIIKEKFNEIYGEAYETNEVLSDIMKNW